MNAVTTIRKVVGILESSSPDVRLAVNKLQSVLVSMEGFIKCPKCGSKDVLIGNGEDPNHCADCGEEWGPHDHSGDEKKEERGLSARLDSALADI